MKNIVLLFLVFPIYLSAQLNESDSLKVKASLSLTGMWQSGNVEALILRGRTDFSVKPWKKWVFKNTNSYVYQAFDKVKADSDFLSLNFLYFNPEKRFYPQVLGFLSTNFRREIDRRYLLGGGATYRILQHKKHWIKASLTFEYEETKFGRSVFNNTNFNDETKISTIRSTFWINGKYELFNKKVILKHEIYYQPSLEQSDNYRWRGELGIEMPIWKYMNFTVNYLRSFESLVIENQEQEDQFLTFGFTLKSF